MNKMLDICYILYLYYDQITYYNVFSSVPMYKLVYNNTLHTSLLNINCNDKVTKIKINFKLSLYQLEVHTS